MIVLVDKLREIVAKVSDALTPSLSLVNPHITGVHFEHGHILEVVETINERAKMEATRYSNYPLVVLVQDYKSAMFPALGVQEKATVRMLILNFTDAAKKAEDRKRDNFEPILWPIYERLVIELQNHPSFFNYSEPAHTKTDHYFWGREGVLGNTGGIFGDWVDCVEIENLELKIKTKTCYGFE